MNLPPTLRADWKAWHTWLGMRLTAIGLALGSLGQAWPYIPDSWLHHMPGWLPTALGWASIASVLCGFGRRFMPRDQ